MIVISKKLEQNSPSQQRWVHQKSLKPLAPNPDTSQFPKQQHILKWLNFLQHFQAMY